MNWGADVVKFGARKMPLSMLVASNLAPWGPSSDAGGLGRTRPWSSRLDFYRFGKDFGAAIWEFLDNFDGLGDRLEVSGFSLASQGALELSTAGRMMVFGIVLGPIPTAKQ